MKKRAKIPPLGRLAQDWRHAIESYEEMIAAVKRCYAALPVLHAEIGKAERAYRLAYWKANGDPYPGIGPPDPGPGQEPPAERKVAE